MIYKLFPSILISAASLVAFYSHLHLVKAAVAEKENEATSTLLAFRDEFERVYRTHCESKTLTECAESNFNDCSSSFPNQHCMKTYEPVISTCGDGERCNALWDKRLAAALAQASLGNTSDPEGIESACYSHPAEQYLIAKYSYFGTHNGLFCKIPFIHQEPNHRHQPLSVAAAGGPKDVVLVIDISGSMKDYGHMDLAKEAAITIVDTLTGADRVAVVSFSSTASQIGGYDSLMHATNENKKHIIQAIKDLKANGATNFYDAFDTVFNALDQTMKNESRSGCNVAVLFMTDGQGQISAGPKANDVINLVNDRTKQLATNFNRKVTVFTFSLGHQADHSVTKSISCNTGGIWSPVDDLSGDLVTAMNSYYKLFAFGLGEDRNEDYTLCVEPHVLYSPAEKMETTVSTPVYDRSAKPPLLLGVVAQVLEEDTNSSIMLPRFVLISPARCPKTDLTECELDALRFSEGGKEATCGACHPFKTNFPRRET